jgi:ABC-type polysaccharide/polyol phosphate export permease
MRWVWDVGRVVVRFRALIRELAMRDIRDRYLEHALGGAWAVMGPLLMLAVYVYLFTVIFPSRLGADDTGLGGVVWILSGLVTWFFITDVMGRAVGALAASSNLVKRVVFPVEIIPVQIVATVLPGFVIGMAVVIVLQAWHQPSVLLGTLYLLPPALLILFAALIGIAYALAAFGPFLRDLREIVQFISMIGMFAAPILYLPTTIAELNPMVKTVLWVNPFTHVVACLRDALVIGAFTAPGSWLAACLFAALMLVGGITVYERLKPHFAEAL